MDKKLPNIYKILDKMNFEQMVKEDKIIKASNLQIPEQVIFKYIQNFYDVLSEEMER